VVTFVTRKAGSRFFFNSLFDVHVLELAGLEDLSALLAFDELGIFVAADDLHAQMLAGLRRLYVLRRRGRL
jgi:hypothetical protein